MDIDQPWYIHWHNTYKDNQQLLLSSRVWITIKVLISNVEKKHSWSDLSPNNKNSIRKIDTFYNHNYVTLVVAIATTLFMQVQRCKFVPCIVARKTFLPPSEWNNVKKRHWESDALATAASSILAERKKSWRQRLFGIKRNIVCKLYGNIMIQMLRPWWMCKGQERELRN